MPAPKSTAKTSELFSHINVHSAELRERSDCSVKAVAIATGIPYKEVHAAFKAAGRTSRRGTYISCSEKAIKSLGYTIEKINATDIIKNYPKAHQILKGVTSHHPERFPNHFPKETFIMASKDHMWAVMDGKNHDWSEGHALRVKRIWKLHSCPSSRTFIYTGE
jgi:hypothetical protein